MSRHPIIMSALAQNRHFASQHHNVRFTPPQKRIFGSANAMSAEGQKRKSPVLRETHDANA